MPNGMIFGMQVIGCRHFHSRSSTLDWLETTRLFVCCLKKNQLIIRGTFKVVVFLYLTGEWQLLLFYSNTACFFASLVSDFS